VTTRIAAILYFLDNNDIELNRRKIKRYYPSDESVNDDRSYTHEEIQRILSVCDLRTKAMILLMASSGVRIGALASMQIGDLIKTPVKFNNSIFKVQVYARTRERYFTFTIPECYNAIQEYLNYKKRCGEEIKDKSPLFRKHFNKHDPFTINVPRFITDDAVMKAVDEVLNKSGVKSTDAMRSHAFRKGLMSICEQKGMKSINVKMLLGHDIGVSGHYYRPAESDILEDYMTHAADALTIDPNQRLEQENQELKTVQAEEIARLNKKMDYVDSMMLALKPLIDAKSQAAHIKESLGLNNKKLRLEDEEG
jgi:integrase